MSRYLAEVDANNVVTRVIVCDDPTWAAARLGGTWVETADPYGAPSTVVYCGPGYGCDPTFPERFAPPWTPPAPDPETGVWSSYPKGTLTFHNGQLWKSTTDGNVWQPGVSAWHPEPDIAGVLPTWIQPTGAHDVWPLGAQVNHAGKRWESLVAANVWVPGSNATLWRDLDAPPPPAVSAWKPWTGINADLYQVGALVTYNGQTWRSTAANNHWTPGVFGWVVV